MMLSNRRRQLRKRPCSFCIEKVEPDYKDNDRLRRFLTERGKIISRTRTGVCQKHQRRLSKAIKQARHMALLPFALGI